MTLNIECPTNCIDTCNASVEISPHKYIDGVVTDYEWTDINLPYEARDIKVPLEVKTIPIYNQMDKADKMLDFYIVPSQDLYNIYISKGMDDRGWFLETMYGIKKNLVLERTIYGKIKLQ